MHPKNQHKDGYHFKELIKVSPELAPFVVMNKFNNESIDFSNPQAVKALNAALLKYSYHVSDWDIPKDYLCPPIPGRADYIHHLADLIGMRGESIRGLDIGTGANLIYPLIGSAEYGWSFVASDIDEKALSSAQKILDHNPHLKSLIELRKQSVSSNIFKGLFKQGEYFHFSMCNPPFHASAEEAREGTVRKWKNLGKKGSALNFGGQSNELWCQGGEKSFVGKMIEESALVREHCRWFTTLVSKEAHLPLFKALLKNVRAQEIKVIEMAQGQKKSRILVWSYLRP